ncbi:MAG: 1-phosphofructokinase [Desulfopila sp.]
MKTATRIVTVTLNPAVDLACEVPGFAPAQVNRVTSARLDPGGKGVNIARLLRHFELPVTATGFLGADNAYIFEKLFRQTGIDDAFIKLPGETRIGIKILDPVNHLTTDLNLPGLAPQKSQLAELFATVEHQLDNAAILVIAGSTPASLSPEAVGQLVTAGKAKDVKVFVDTSGAALHEAIAAAPSLIKPNAEELSEYVGRPLTEIADIHAEAARLLATGIETVVVSLGERGALFVENDDALLLTPPRITAVSTVGAGDAMIGTMAAGLVMNMPLAQRARLATAVSAAVVTQAGPSLPSLAGAKALEQQVHINHITLDGGKDA